MKPTKYILLIAFVSFSFICEAQTEFKKLCDAFKNEKGVSIVQLDDDLIDLYKRSHLSKETEEMIKKLESVNILNITIDKNKHTQENISNIVNKYFNFDNYKIVKSNTHNRGYSKIYVKKIENKVRRLIAVNSGWREYNLILITGEIDIANLKKLTYALNIEGIENLNNINSKEYQFFHGNNIHSNNEKELKRLKIDIDRMRSKMKEEKFFKGEEFNEKEFEQYWEEFGEKMAKWGEKMAVWGENVAKAIEKEVEKTTLVNDEDYNITLDRKGKTTIKISSDDNSVYVLDGREVTNSKIKDLSAGKIHRVCVIKRSEKGKKDNNHVLIYTAEPDGKFISYSNSGVLKFKYKGKTYTYNTNEKDFVGFIVNGKKEKKLKKNLLGRIIQIRPITNTEKEALNCKEIRILIETK
eukprot:Anaeramoba_ignava/a484057_19.p1 GENE.a484057_19~~a484057_19.p1  ORF type:complete len:411 (-),score=46.90 a484057_19:34-1266(-)